MRFKSLQLKQIEIKVIATLKVKHEVNECNISNSKVIARKCNVFKTGTFHLEFEFFV